MRATTELVCYMFGITRRTLSRWKAAGCPDAGREVIIEPVDGKLTRYCTYRLTDVSEWLNETGRLTGLVKSYNAQYETSFDEKSFMAMIYGCWLGVDTIVDHGTFPFLYYFHRELHLIDEYERGERCRYLLAEMEREKAEGAAS
jgi:hypothetical protein